MNKPLFKPGDFVHNVVTICHLDESLDYEAVECGVVVMVAPSAVLPGMWEVFAACYEPDHKPHDIESLNTNVPFILRYFDVNWRAGWPHREGTND